MGKNHRNFFVIMGIEESLFKQVPVPGHGVRVQPPELVPEHGAQICARAPMETTAFA